MGQDPAVEIVEITTATWPVFEELFRPGGAGGCWCSWFRVSSKEFDALDSAGRKEFVRSRVEAGEPFGLVAKVAGEPLGWVSVAPRSCHVRMARSSVARLAPGEDGEGLWTVGCFYISRRGRGRGLSRTLLEAAVEHAARSGASAVEGYPVDTGGASVPAPELYHGTLGTFLAAGFEQVERRGARRVLVRRMLD